MDFAKDLEEDKEEFVYEPEEVGGEAGEAEEKNDGGFLARMLAAKKG